MRLRDPALTFAGRALLPLIAVVMVGVLQAEPRKPTHWERQISAFEKQDRQQMPPKQGIVFIGSSTVKGWKLEENFADLPVIGRGFGGSQTSDAVYYAGRIILPYKPKIVVLYEGDNDIAAGKTPQQVAADYRQFVKIVHDALPKTRILFLAIKPSIKRWPLIDNIREANKFIREQTERDPLQVYIDTDKPMLGEDGKPRPELFRSDGLHMSKAGYKLWADLLMPHFKLD